MSTVGIVASTVTWFEKQADRTKVRVKRDDLDTLTETWVGPSAYEDTFVPVVGQAHPDYNLMTVINTSVHRLPAGVSEIRVEYHGKITNGGGTGYTSVPTINKYWSEGEVTYQVNSGAGETAVFQTSTGPYVWTYEVQGIASFSRRYTGRCVELAYITNRTPSGEPSNIGLANGYLGFQNVWDTMSGFSEGQQISGGGTIEQMACTDVRVEDRADGWFRVTETYQSRMFPGPVGWTHPPPHMTTSTHPSASISTDTTQYNSLGYPIQDGKPDSNVVSFDGGTTTGAAQGAADSAGVDLPSSDPGSVGADTYAQLAVDPVWDFWPASGSGAAGSSAIDVASASAYGSADVGASTGMASTPYDG